MVTTIAEFIALNEALSGRLVPFKGQYQKSLTSDTFELFVQDGSFESGSRKVLFDCELSSMDGSLDGRKLGVQFTHDGICSCTPDQETQAYLDRDASKAKAKELDDLCAQITQGGK
jgi:hypothetical protein